MAVIQLRHELLLALLLHLWIRNVLQLLLVVEHQELLLQVHRLEMLLLELWSCHVRHEGLLPAGEGGEIQVACGFRVSSGAWQRWRLFLLGQVVLLKVEVECVAVLVQWLNVAEYGAVG